MEVEVQSMPQSVKAQCQNRVRLSKAELAKLRAQAVSSLCFVSSVGFTITTYRSAYLYRKSYISPRLELSFSGASLHLPSHPVRSTTLTGTHNGHACWPGLRLLR